ncbi:hypothetical protein [uncultured Fretibacterium sp.]|uniref:hypothetical protein n=1 Tax=uncultured Fretibacterium sp. TaxID=1678694 RepID=UPI002627DE36|nr:hypothetical protein [uncultured Fretibacterium sp.]
MSTKKKFSITLTDSDEQRVRLAAALEAAYMVLKPQKSRFEDYVDAVTLARAALAKARGEVE